ncbi:PrsW family intramembrane metalloprotease [Arthrobacter glacialis]|uniref:PrsW family intramembrane metalloprotease n=1 Tax=Arthrobacter glacialis TaxID=1664 RepID=A0A2S3ZXA3_ARTGL|nr:PrsW family intramembrane metalloprotease [Arthrobacter glacialis]POH58772.1 PrsW family intramembrane metalloprotease [Arthrobacter glacialis]POH73704.1 PrsW family intramembrane metalloprotease [Arthrobacter glacialis]
MSEPGHWQNTVDGAPNQQPQYAQPPLPQAQGPGTALNYRPDYWAHPAPAPVPKRAAGTGTKVMNIILLCVFGLVAMGTLVFFAFSLGVSVFLICGLLALIPLTICVLTLLWIDRWEPEPIPALVLGFCWGAGMAVITTLVLGSWVQPLLMSGGSEADADMVGAVIQAPLVEEFCKGVGLLLLFFLRRRTFDGPVDGVVYAGIIAAGFAFTENILYFGNELQESQGAAGGLVAIFVMRGLMSPFAHVMFTAALGLCVGYAARNGGTLMVLGAWVVGLIPAMLLHGLWNGTSFLGANFFLVYGVLQVPLFIVFILGIIWLRRSEAKLTRKRLADYVPSGWFTEPEVPMLATGAGRRRAMAWSKTFAAGPVMKEFIRLATRLAFTRQRLLVDAKGAPGSGAARRFATGQVLELRLLEKITAVRNELLGRHAHTVWAAQQIQQAQLAQHIQHQNQYLQGQNIQGQNAQPPHY